MPTQSNISLNPELLQKRYDRLFNLVARMRAKQVEYEWYHASDDRAAKKQLERQVDAIVKEELKERKSKQSNLF